MSDKNDEKLDTADKRKPSTTLPGHVEKIIESPHPDEPERAEIAVPDAEPLYQEIRIENKLHDEDGKEVRLKPGASVDVTIEADAKDTEENE
jgi:uncharacterized cupredoxin-like copper-binding protein